MPETQSLFSEQPIKHMDNGFYEIGGNIYSPRGTLLSRKLNLTVPDESKMSVGNYEQDKGFIDREQAGGQIYERPQVEQSRSNIEAPEQTGQVQPVGELNKMTFGQAFRSQRNAGADTFNWRGMDYNTMTAEEAIKNNQPQWIFSDQPNYMGGENEPQRSAVTESIEQQTQEISTEERGDKSGVARPQDSEPDLISKANELQRTMTVAEELYESGILDGLSDEDAAMIIDGTLEFIGQEEEAVSAAEAYQQYVESGQRDKDVAIGIGRGVLTYGGIGLTAYKLIQNKRKRGAYWKFWGKEVPQQQKPVQQFSRHSALETEGTKDRGTPLRRDETTGRKAMPGERLSIRPPQKQRVAEQRARRAYKELVAKQNEYIEKYSAPKKTGAPEPKVRQAPPAAAPKGRTVSAEEAPQAIRRHQEELIRKASERAAKQARVAQSTRTSPASVANQRTQPAGVQQRTQPTRGPQSRSYTQGHRTMAKSLFMGMPLISEIIGAVVDRRQLRNMDISELENNIYQIEREILTNPTANKTQLINTINHIEKEIERRGTKRQNRGPLI